MKQTKDPTTKPYYKCLSCSRFRNVCGGIPTRGMDLQEWCEYMRDVKELALLTNAYIAKEAEVSKATIEKIMALNYDTDIMRATARRIELVVIGQVGEHICYINSESKATERMDELLAAVAHLRKECDRYAKIIDKYLD